MQLEARPASVLANLAKTVSPKAANAPALDRTIFFPPGQTVKHAAMVPPRDGRSVQFGLPPACDADNVGARHQRRFLPEAE
jgi:hypothetical protein